MRRLCGLLVSIVGLTVVVRLTVIRLTVVGLTIVRLTLGLSVIELTLGRLLRLAVIELTLLRLSIIELTLGGVLGLRLIGLDGFCRRLLIFRVRGGLLRLFVGATVAVGVGIKGIVVHMYLLVGV